jgi:hypothetical protein
MTPPPAWVARAGHYPCRTDRQQRQRLPAHVVVYYAAPRAPRLSTT